MSRRKWFAIGAGGFLVACSALAYVRQDPLKRGLAELKRQGLPSTYADIVALAPTGGTNAQESYKKYDRDLSKIRSGDANKAYLDVIQGGWSRLTQAEQDRESHLLEPYARYLVEGSQADHWPLMRADGREDSEQYAKPKAGINLLCSLAVTEGRVGKVDRALDHLRAAIRINYQIGENPSFFTQLSSVMRERNIMRSFHQLMQVHSKNPAVLQEGLNFLSSLPPTPDFRDALKCMCADYLLSPENDEDTLQYWFRGENDPTWFDQMKDRVWYRPQVHRWLAADVRVQADTLSQLPAGTLDWDATQEVYRRADKRVDKNTKPKFLADMPDTVGFIAKELDYWGRKIAVRRVEETALRVQLMRIHDGALPSSLPSFGNSSIDPFTRSALKYRKDGAGFVVWSIDIDRVDNGGARNLAGVRNNDVVSDF